VIGRVAAAFAVAVVTVTIMNRGTPVGCVLVDLLQGRHKRPGREECGDSDDVIIAQFSRYLTHVGRRPVARACAIESRSAGSIAGPEGKQIFFQRECRQAADYRYVRLPARAVLTMAVEAERRRGGGPLGGRHRHRDCGDCDCDGDSENPCKFHFRAASIYR